jgi:phosphoadenosine phosphosulfate reductase
MHLPELSDIQLLQLNIRFESMSTIEILEWAWQSFAPHLAASSSFQTQSVPLLHLIAQNCPEMPIIFLDTEMHFPETLHFKDELQARFKLNIITVRPIIERHELADRYGVDLPEQHPDLCCYIHKVEPMQHALAGFQAWITGTRRDQTEHRQKQAILERQAFGLLKIQPMLNWTKTDIYTYIEQHKLPHHPLLLQGYQSIGCAPCTYAVPSEDERAGRWPGQTKTECGLHTRTIDSLAD